MKNIKYYLLGIFIILQSSFLLAQDDCKVIVPELQGTYTGKCKKGLAHGQGKAVGKDTYEGSFKKGYPHGNGTYTWSTGETYVGRWKMGERDGEGSYHFQVNGIDSIKDGIWENDKYKGPKIVTPKVIHKEAVLRYSFKRMSDGNSLFFTIKSNGTVNRDLEDLSVISSSGVVYQNTNSIGVETINFPVIVKIKFRAWNATHTERHNVTFEFEISQPGNWSVDIVN
ncbi:MAG: hypothetical protein C0595_09815 [Marinilabiliales bacterium]|nr:MAG: hypothetical protein C0595_09815 [Marinilabiliales bacterium]